MQKTEYKTVKAQVKAMIDKPKTGMAAEYRLLNWLLKRDWQRHKDHDKEAIEREKQLWWRNHQ